MTIGDNGQANDNENGEVNDNENNDDSDEDENDNENENEASEGTLSPDQVVLAVVCISEDGQLIIVQIIILEDNDNDEDGSVSDGEKVLVCPKPSKNAHTLSISSSAVPAHLGHGDTLGPCP